MLMRALQVAPSNMALQRTRRPRLRSGRSLCSLGSPLNAYPLGAFSGRAILVAAVTLAACRTQPGSLPKSFDSQKWKEGEAAPHTTSAPRLQMADDLVASRALRGLRRDAVVALLGPPTRTDKWRNWDLVYWLGAERSYISIDSEWLVLRAGPDGRVNEAKIVRD
jgi:hypothetical protein